VRVDVGWIIYSRNPALIRVRTTAITVEIYAEGATAIGRYFRTNM